MSSYFRIKYLKINHSNVDGSRNVLELENINIPQGSSYGLVGESGAGKTVLAQTILGLLPTPPGEIISGEILLDGVDLLKKSESEMRKIRGKKIAMIFQDPMSSLNPVYTVGYQLIQVIKENQNLKYKEAFSVALKMIETVHLADGNSIMQKYPHQISGGQRQRIIIAMALSCGAEFIIADEPTRNLDVTIQAGILKLLKELQKKFKVTILFIANNLGLVSAVCDEIGILYKGKLIEQGKVDQILQNPVQDYTKSLIQAVTPDSSRSEKSINLDHNQDIIRVHNLKKYFPIKKSAGSKNGTIIKAVDGVSFSIKKGEILGIVGESGCGKSTLVNTLLLLEEATHGEVFFNEESLFELKKKDLNLKRKDIQIVFQDPYWSLNPRWLVKDIIGEPLKVHYKYTADEFQDRIVELLQLVGLDEDDGYKYPHEFSGGQRQRIAIARALSVKPKLIVLDEPTSSIDIISQAKILDLLYSLKEKMGLTYIIISHDLSVVNNMSDKILVMYLGKIVEQGKATNLFNSPLHPYTKALFNAIPGINTKDLSELSVIKGSVPSAINIPTGCRFHPRCEQVLEICRVEEPEEKEVNNTIVACHLYS
ncbi:MAG: ABC transporter ATP-binding protein [Spirochaetes bacterium]|nr:MAG: ABC transporter ATP-binding protein [Spirochaetota bacterium]